MKLRMKNERPYSHNGFRDFFGEFESLLLRQKVKPSSFNNCWVFLTLPKLSGVRLSCFFFSFFAVILQNLRKNYG